MIDKEATCGRDGCLATAYTDYIGELEATIAELREAAREAVDAVRFQKPEHERAAIDALAAILDATLEQRV